MLLFCCVNLRFAVFVVVSCLGALLLVVLFCVFVCVRFFYGLAFWFAVRLFVCGCVCILLLRFVCFGCWCCVLLVLVSFCVDHVFLLFVVVVVCVCVLLLLFRFVLCVCCCCLC